MKVLPLFVSLLAAMVVLSGCALANPGASARTEVKLRLQTPTPERYTVRVALEPVTDYRVGPNGTVEFTVRPFVHGDCWYLFGAIRICDGSPERVPVIEVRRDQRVHRKLSLAQTASLPADDSGYRILRLRD